MKEQRDLFSICVLVSVQRLDQDKDADEDVDADHARTGDGWKWTIDRFVYTARGHRHWLQSVWIATMQLWNKEKTSVCANSWKRSRIIFIDELFKRMSIKNTAPQPIRWKIKNDDLWKGQCKVVRAMRNNSKSAMLRMPSPLESRSDLLHLFRGLQCTEEMSQKEFWCNSRSLPTRLNKKWFETQNWVDWGEVHRDGQINTGKQLLLPIVWGVRKISQKLVFHTEQIRQKCTDETPIRLPRSTYLCARSPPWIWRKATWTNSAWSISKVAFVFFLQYLMEAVEWTLVELIS